MAYNTLIIGITKAIFGLITECSTTLPKYCILLHSGETDPSVIQKNVHKAAGGNMSLFCLGFGYDVHYGFLDVMAKQNDGLARRIYEASDAVLQLQVHRLKIDICCV